MRAAVFHRFRAPLSVEHVPDPTPPADGVVIAVEACGVCRSDWHAWTGADPDVAPPHVPGHEFAGTILSVGDHVRALRPGMRVVAPFILACGRCPTCRNADPTVCGDQHVVGFSAAGAFAQQIAVPHADFNMVPLPEGFSAVTAAAMGCRFTTAFRALTERAALLPGEWLAVHGAGGVGLSAVMLGAALGASVIAVDIEPARLALARDFGATETLNASDLASDLAGNHAVDGGVGQAVRDLTGGGAHVSIDALGSTETVLNSIESLRPLGRHVQIGMPTGEHARPALPLDMIYGRQLGVLGTRGMAARRFPALMAMIGAGRVDPARLVTRRIALAAAGAELAAMDSPAGAGPGIAVITDFS